MKRKLFLCVAVAIFIVVGFGLAITNAEMHTNLSGNILSLTTSIEALASGEGSRCVSAPHVNTGDCKRKADNSGDECIKASFWDSWNNCYTTE